MVRRANLTSCLLFKCLHYCKFLESPPEGRNLFAVGLFCLIEMVRVENMARQKIVIKGYSYLAIRDETLAVVGNSCSWHMQQ